MALKDDLPYLSFVSNNLKYLQYLKFDRTAYTSGRFTLELDHKKPVGFITSIDGGNFQAEAVSSTVGNQSTTRYPGKPKYDDITITVGMAMAPAFWSWVQATLDNKPERRNGALVGYDFNNKERARRTFTRALITEIGFPALDGASKSSALLTVKISPEKLEYAEGDNKPLIHFQSPFESIQQKKWLTSNFRFALDRFAGDVTLRNAKIEAFAVKQSIIHNPVGSEREVRKEPGRVELPSLQVTFPETQMGKWMKWYEETVVRGVPKNTTGALTYYAPNTLTELMRLDFHGVGLSSLDVERYEAAKESIAKVKATLYFESLKLKPGLGNA